MKTVIFVDVKTSGDTSLVKRIKVSVDHSDLDGLEASKIAREYETASQVAKEIAEDNRLNPSCVLVRFYTEKDGYLDYHSGWKMPSVKVLGY